MDAPIAIRLRRAEPAEIDELRAIDDDAAALFTGSRWIHKASVWASWRSRSWMVSPISSS